MTPVERIFYAVLAFPSPSELLPLARALRAVELHIRREAAARIEEVEQEVVYLREEVRGLRAFKRSVDEALNSGEGYYRP
jgi:hypothetical protein